jgi:hypothetical protein
MTSEINDLAGLATEDTLVAQVRDERFDYEVEMAVNRGIAAAALVSFPEALKIMDEAGIPKNISLRVLNSKSRRRASDWR